MLVNGKDITVRANGINICYDDLGVGGTPILFIHGFPFDKSMWEPQMDYFKSRHRVIAYDIRGFGKSTITAEEPSMSLFAYDLINLLDALEIANVIACGLSMGGYILLDAVDRYPERFRAIVLSDTQCIADSTEAKEKRYNTIEQVKAEGVAGFAEGFIKNVFCEESFRNKTGMIEKIKQVVLSTSTETVTSTLGALAQRMERCSSLDRVDVPSLIVCGTEDKVTPLAQSEFLHAHISESVLATIGMAGHLSNLEQPDQFNKHLAAFISGVTK